MKKKIDYIKYTFMFITVLFFGMNNCFANSKYIYAETVNNGTDIDLKIYSKGDISIYGFLGTISYDSSNLILNRCNGESFTVTMEKNRLLLEDVNGHKNTIMVTCNFKVIGSDVIGGFAINDISLSNGNKVLYDDNLLDIVIDKADSEDTNSSENGNLENDNSNKDNSENDNSENDNSENDNSENDNSENVTVNPSTFGGYIIIPVVIIGISLGTLLIIKKKYNLFSYLVIVSILCIPPFISFAIDTNGVVVTDEQLSEIRNILLKKNEDNTNNKYDFDEDNKMTVNDLIFALLGKTIKVSSISLNKTSQTLYLDTKENKVTLTATIKPSNATDKTVTWKSSNTSVATVSNGVVTAKGLGTATITAVSGGKSASAEIKVENKTIVVSSISLNKTSQTLYLDTKENKVTLTATVSPSNATDKTVTWKSSNTSVATVSNGVVTAKGLGTATITAVSGGKSASAEIKVENLNDTTLPSIKSCLSVIKGNKTEFTVVTENGDASKYVINDDSSLTFYQKEYTVNRVIENAKVTAYASGNNKTTVYCDWYYEPINPKGNENIIKQNKTNTLKVWIELNERSSRIDYYTTHIWVKDIHKQFKTHVPDDYGNRLLGPNTLFTDAINDYKLKNKLAVAVNASGFVLNGVWSQNYYDADSRFNKTSVAPVVIVNGVIKRDLSGANMPGTPGGIMGYHLYGITNEGKLKYYNYYVGVDSRNSDVTKQVINDGVKNTFAFGPILVRERNGSVENMVAAETTYHVTRNVRQAMCQIDKNNFVFITDIYGESRSGFAFKELAEYMISLGCKEGYNLDGGGSTSLIYKSPDKSGPENITNPGREMADIVFFHE